MKKTLKYILPFLIGCAFLPIPLLGDFHFESALIVATVGCFWGGISASSITNDRYYTVFISIFRSIYLFGLPLFIFSFSTNCLTWNGFLFWILVPIPSVLFGVALGRFYKKLSAPFPSIITVISLLFISVGILLMEFYSLPQVYFFNHVWGAWPGPIYDETVKVTGSLYYFRGITLLWVLILWVAPIWKKSMMAKVAVTSSVLVLIPAYIFMSDFGLSTSRATLQNQFTKVETSHFDIYYSLGEIDEQEINYWALKHEHHFEQIIKLLDVEWPEGRKIESYLYDNAWQKKILVGAKFTSYVPIWLEQDQLHIAQEHLDDVLKHELVHVVSKQFGNSIFNGTWSIGLIEGVAEGIAKDASSQSTLDQILAADPPYPTADEMSNALSIRGFYSNAGSISYTTTGSFVNYLLKHYPVSNFKEAYAHSDFEGAYQIQFDSLVSGWHQTLPDIEIDSVDQQVSNFVFSQRSIFQKNCPHLVTPIMKLWDEVRYFETENQNRDALPLVNSLYQLAPENLTIKLKWAQYQLDYGNYDDVINSVNASDSIPNFIVLKADAFALKKEWANAYDELEKVWMLLPNKLPRSFKYSFELRRDTLQWNHFNANRYHKYVPNVEEFNDMNLPNQLLSIQLQSNFFIDSTFAEASRNSLLSPKNEDWFDIYEAIIDKLIFLEEYELAQNWINEVSTLELRPRYAERLQEQKEWLIFQSTN